jgi:uncharacterized protein (DUF983 family)
VSWDECNPPKSDVVSEADRWRCPRCGKHNPRAAVTKPGVTEEKCSECGGEIKVMWIDLDAPPGPLKN